MLFPEFGQVKQIFYSIIRVMLRIEENPDFKNVPIKKIVLFRTGGLGEVVVFIPTILAIRFGFPNVHITVVTSSPGAEILNNKVYCDELIICSLKQFIKKSIFQKLNFILTMRKKNFDLVILSTQDTYSWLDILVLLSGAHYRVGFVTNKNYLVYNKHITPDENKSEIERNLDIVRGIGIEVTNCNPIIYISQDDIRFIENLLIEKRISLDDLLVVISPSGSRASRNWFTERYAELADKIIEEYCAKVIFTGGSENEDFIAGIMKLMTNSSLNLAGKITIGQLAALIERSDLFITVDSGPMHLAAALRKAVIALFGPGDYKKWGYSGQGWFHMIRKEMECSPCYKIECRPHRCMEMISVEEVMNKIENIFTQSFTQKRMKMPRKG